MQREAQRLLEQASTGRTDAEENARPGEREKGRGESSEEFGSAGDVPDKGNLNDAEAFRRRVLEGLGKGGSSRLSPAVKRYAEGLLR